MLYGMSRDPKLTFSNTLSQYKRAIRSSYELYLYNILLLTEIAKYAQHDARVRSEKHLPSEDDKQFKAKLFENELIQTLVKNPAFSALMNEHSIRTKLNKDTVRLLYNEFLKTDKYKEYLANTDQTTEDHRQILLGLYKHCTGSDTFNDEMDDHFSCWVDDKSLVIGTVKKTIKLLPTDDNILGTYRPSEETTVEFGEALLKQVNDKNEALLEVIEPMLKNWDADRVAIIDMVSLKMALCELTSFPTIPTKVTLNEFVEISKMYSTDKSKDFINGILDRLLKKLEKDGMIQKEGRGLKD